MAVMRLQSRPFQDRDREADSPATTSLLPTTLRRAVSSRIASPMCAGEVAGGHRHFPFVGFRQIAGHAVQVHGSLQAASASSSCASHAAIMPVSTSPVPPVAMPGLPVGLMNTLPSGVAISVRCPLSTTYT